MGHSGGNGVCELYSVHQFPVVLVVTASFVVYFIECLVTNVEFDKFQYNGLSTAGYIQYHIQYQFYINYTC